MQINVNVDGLDAIDLNTVIGDSVTQYDEDGDAIQGEQLTLGDLVAEKLANKIYAGLDYDGRYELSKKAGEERVKLIRERLVPQVEEVLSGEIQKTNNYGEPNGQKTTMRELVIAEITRVVNAKGDRYHSSENTPLINRVVTAEVNRVLGTELAEVFKAEKDKVVAAVRAQAAELVAEAVAKGVGR